MVKAWVANLTRGRKVGSGAKGSFFLICKMFFEFSALVLGCYILMMMTD